MESSSYLYKILNAFNSKAPSVVRQSFKVIFSLANFFGILLENGSIAKEQLTNNLCFT